MSKLFDKFRRNKVPAANAMKVDTGLPKKPADNPYLNSRRVWNDHVGSVLSSKRMWQAVALLSLMMALGAVGGIVHIGSQSKFVPYVIQTDKLGGAIAVGRADRAGPVDERVMQATLAAFVADARLVTPDVALQRNAVFRLYSMLNPNDPATPKMNEWLNGSKDSSPFARAAKEAVSVEIMSAIPQTPETWQIDWRETVRDRQGALKEKYVMRALITVYVVAPSPETTDEQIRRNPLGIYVRDYNWAKQI